MLDAHSPLWQHMLQNVALLVLSLAFLPVDTFVLVLSRITNVFLGRSPSLVRRDESGRTILITGVGMTKGLALARLFAAAGDTVIGADGSPLACGRFSRCLSAFHVLQKPGGGEDRSAYVNSLLSIIRREKVDIWVSCSGVASAIEDGVAKEAVEATSTCKAVQYDVETTKLLHEKSSFINHVAHLGLTIPETYHATDKRGIEEVLLHVRDSRKYICKCVCMDDASRGDMTLLPLDSKQATISHVNSLNVSERNPWIVQQYIDGREYCTHSLVVRGQVKAFVACPSSELLMYYEALPPDSELSKAMLRFTQRVANAGGEAFTGHLSFDFLIEEADLTKSALDLNLYPIECNPRAHTAVALFESTPEMVDAYHSLLDLQSGSDKTDIVFPRSPRRYYWVGHDLICLALLPIVDLLRGREPLSRCAQMIASLLEHLVFWKDGTFELHDPIPWWWLYHVYWPAQFLTALLGKEKWSRINVSTTKMFMC